MLPITASELLNEAAGERYKAIGRLFAGHEDKELQEQLSARGYLIELAQVKIKEIIEHLEDAPARLSGSMLTSYAYDAAMCQTFDEISEDFIISAIQALGYSLAYSRMHALRIFAELRIDSSYALVIVMPDVEPLLLTV